MNLTLWSPFSSFVRRTQPEFVPDHFVNEFDSWMNHFWNEPKQSFSPTIEVKEKDNHFELIAEIPGMSKEEINIEIKEDTLTIQGERKSKTEAEKEKGYHYSERRFGRFSRSFTLPDGVNTSLIEATHKNGILTLNIPKPEEKKVEVRKIEVN